MSNARQRAVALEKTLQCNCDLDNWQPEASTGHSVVCRIHAQATGSSDYSARVLSRVDQAYDNWALSRGYSSDEEASDA